jgi:hypothetical protein
LPAVSYLRRLGFVRQGAIEGGPRFAKAREKSPPSVAGTAFTTPPTKYWFSTLLADIVFHPFANTAKPRWRIGRDDPEFKQEVGLSNLRGRDWGGFYQCAMLGFGAYGFLVCEGETISPGSASALKELQLRKPLV